LNNNKIKNTAVQLLFGNELIFMIDILFLGLITIFFTSCLAYITACEGL